jgi:hypothetical protein
MRKCGSWRYFQIRSFHTPPGGVFVSPPVEAPPEKGQEMAGTEILAKDEDPAMGLCPASRSTAGLPCPGQNQTTGESGGSRLAHGMRNEMIRDSEQL